jgi:hypothetical protein
MCSRTRRDSDLKTSPVVLLTETVDKGGQLGGVQMMKALAMIVGVLIMGRVRDGVYPRHTHRASVADRTIGMAGMAAVRTAAQARVEGAVLATSHVGP